MIGACVVLLSVALTGTWGEHSRPFFDPDCFSSDCSWSWDTLTPGHQFCERIVYNNSMINVCPNPFTPPTDQNERPDKAQEVAVTDFIKSFRSSSQPETFEKYTCLNITYKISKNVANKVKGIQLSVQGVDYPDMNQNYCLNLNFSDRGLDYYAVEDRTFSMQCFCGLKPGIQYRYTVRTLPVDPNPLDPDDTQVQDYYTPSDCTDPSKQDDIRCQTSMEARWGPECFDAVQQFSSGEYDILEVKFNVAPASYTFDKYRIFIYKTSPGPAKIYKDVNTTDAIDRMCPPSQELVSTIVHRFDISALDKGLEYIAKVNPRPSSKNNCLDSNEEETACKTSASNPFQLIADPCLGNPCGEPAIGWCLPLVDSYSCQCTQGYKEWIDTCVVDLCWVEADVVPPCENGQCQYIYPSSLLDYYCTCNEGFDYLKNPKMCVANPCNVREETELTVCGSFGQCQKNLTNDQVSYTCVCDEGYKFEHGECREPIAIGKIVGIATASCLVGLLLFVIAFCLYRHINNPDDKSIVKQQEGDKKVDRFCYRRVLPIYSEDDPCHKNVIHCFCRFLKEHCKCEVSLMDWQKTVSPTVGMWLAAEIDKADVVLLICSKGTGKKYKDKARQKMTPSSDGVYGDVFIQALNLLEAYFSKDDACEKFVVCYFDYSSEEDIPISFRRFAKYHLMKCMDSLFLRIHDRVKDSPGSSRRVRNLEEACYPNLDMGKPLHAAIEAMKELIKREPKWYQKFNKGSGARESSFESSKPSLSQMPPLNFVSHQISMDSAYDSTDMAQISNEFFKDTASSGRSSTGSDFERSLQQFRSFPVKGDAAVEIPVYHDNDIDDPVTRFFTEDIHLTMKQDPFQSSDFFSDIQMGDVTNRQSRSHSFV